MQSIIDHNINGILVTPGDVEQLKNAIENLYKDDKKCIELGKQGKKKAQKDYNNKMIYNELLRTYNFILKPVNK